MNRTFSLTGLLRVRKVQEREAAQRLSRAAIEERQAQARERQLRTALGTGVDEEAMDAAALAALAASRAAGRALLGELAGVAEIRRHELTAAQTAHGRRRREVRGLEKLADAHDRDLRAEDLRAEQAEIDEIAGRTRREEAMS